MPDVSSDATRCAVVCNPTKVSDGFRALVTERTEAVGWAPPLWLETSEDDPGRGMTREALAAGVDVVLAAGGDGTIRVVADATGGLRHPAGGDPGGHRQPAGAQPRPAAGGGGRPRGGPRRPHPRDRPRRPRGRRRARGALRRDGRRRGGRHDHGRGRPGPEEEGRPGRLLRRRREGARPAADPHGGQRRRRPPAPPPGHDLPHRERREAARRPGADARRAGRRRPARRLRRLPAAGQPLAQARAAGHHPARPARRPGGLLAGRPGGADAAPRRGLPARRRRRRRGPPARRRGPPRRADRLRPRSAAGPGGTARPGIPSACISGPAVGGTLGDGSARPAVVPAA